MGKTWGKRFLRKRSLRERIKDPLYVFPEWILYTQAIVNGCVTDELPFKPDYRGIYHVEEKF